MNSAYATRGRCLGTDPKAPGDTTKTVNYSGVGTVKAPDETYMIDKEAVEAAGITTGGYAARIIKYE